MFDKFSRETNRKVFQESEREKITGEAEQRQKGSVEIAICAIRVTVFLFYFCLETLLYSARMPPNPWVN